MVLDVQYKDVTFETLNQPDFLEVEKKAFPDENWDKVYNEFRAAGESGHELLRLREGTKADGGEIVGAH